ncbi:hypothetical protein D3C80_1440720 [compost metagenome]
MLSERQELYLRSLFIHKAVAVDFRQAVLLGERPQFEVQVNSSADWCPFMSRGEAERHLNVSSFEVTWLARHGYLGNEAKDGGFVPRELVEAVGREFVGTREIAMLAGCTTASVAWSLRSMGIQVAIQDIPFWRRDELLGVDGAIHQLALTREKWAERNGGRR